MNSSIEFQHFSIQVEDYRIERKKDGRAEQRVVEEDEET
jgi:hypothetical protein